MTTLLDFPVLFSETVARVRARMDADVNAGLSVDDDAYIDTREGSFYADMAQVAALEMVRLWDAFTEAVAAAFPSTAWGEYLDEHGTTFNLTRNPAIPSTGTVLFISDISGVLIATGTQVTAQPTDPSSDALVFQTTADGTTVTQLTAPTGGGLTEADTGGFLSADTYYYHVTSYNTFGETTGTADIAGVVGSSTGIIHVSWSAVSGATGYRIYRSLIPNTIGQLIGDVGGTTFTDNGTVTPSTVEPVVNTTAGARIPVQAVAPGEASNLGADALVFLSTPVADVIVVTNESPTVGGVDVESDDDFRARLLGQYQGTGSGTQQDYVAWSFAFGVERVSVVPNWDGAGTVLVTAMLADGSPVSSDVVDGLQAYLDPIAGQGAGRAPIGAIVTVNTSVALNVSISATITHETGFSLDGAGGTTATRPAILAALTDYLNTLQPGDTIIFQHVLAAMFVLGVHQVGSLLVNTGTSNITLTTSPPQVPLLSTVLLT